MRPYLRIPALLHRAVARSIQHDFLNLAQSTAYSAMVTLFPALIVTAAVIGLIPDTAPFRYQLSAFFDRILPPDVSPLLQSYFVTSPHNIRSSRVLIAAFFVSLSGASSVMATIMEGLRRANDLTTTWNFWRRRARAYLLVPLSLLPLVIVSLVVVFGHLLTHWLAAHTATSAHTTVYLIASLIRWTVALLGSVALIALVYHMGTPIKQSWKRNLPGAVAATVMWFLSTIVFGWYVTRFANYSQVYGSLGAAIALLFWLYLVSYSVLCGAEFNALYCAHFYPQVQPSANPAPSASPADRLAPNCE